MTKLNYDIPKGYDIYGEWKPEQHFQRLDKYSTFLWDEGRLETWEEVVGRAVDSLAYLSNFKCTDEEYQMMFEMIYKLEALPSMRLLSMPIAAIQRCNTVIYNCTAGLGDTFYAIAEAQYLSMSGSGVTWSAEKKNVDKLPKIPYLTGEIKTYIIEDTQVGWAQATAFLLEQLVLGIDVLFDYSLIRPNGAPLKTKGGYASGPQILIDTHNFFRTTLRNSQGRKVTPLEMHDMFCYALESGVSGGIRRCLSEGTKVLTNNGSVNIEDISIGDLAFTPNGYRKVTNVFEQGMQSVTKITMSNDTVVEATPNHRLAIPTENGYEWKYVDELNIGDKLFLNGVSHTNTADKRLIPVEITNIEIDYRTVATYDIEVEDEHCFFANGILSHNSAGMCIFDFDNEDIRTCKYDGFWEHPIHKVRANANNSAVWPDNLTKEDIDVLTYQMFSTGGGEPGAFKRNNAVKTSPEWRNILHPEHLLVNPCSEIFLQPAPIDSQLVAGGGFQFCNLSTVNVRNNEDVNTLLEKTRIATLMGDIQSLATDFNFLRTGTKQLCDHDRLLGVNLVGYATSPLIQNNPTLVMDLRDYTVECDLEFAERFGVNRSAALTSVKPSGNSSILCYTAPGSNPIHGQYQIRNVTVNRNSSMHAFLEAQNVPRNDYPGRDYASMFSFPIEYPEGSITLENCNALEQLEIWKYHKVYWTHHNPSVSITYEPDEIDGIKEWLFENQDIIGGLAFFPKYDASYGLLPIVVVNKERYDEFTSTFPTIDWSLYSMYESGADERQIIAECAGGACEIQW